MYILLITIHVISCLVLILVILLQSGRGGGLSESFGSSSSSSTIFGTSASTFLQRATSVCAIVFLLTSLSLAVLSSRKSRSLMELERIKKMFPAAEKGFIPPQEPMAELPKEEGIPLEAEEIPTGE